jgi:hypothetical protein
MSLLDDLSCQSFREVMGTDFEVRHEGGSVDLKLVDPFFAVGIVRALPEFRL